MERASKAGLVAAAVAPAAVPAGARAALGALESAAVLVEPGVPAGQVIEGRGAVPRKHLEFRVAHRASHHQCACSVMARTTQPKREHISSWREDPMGAWVLVGTGGRSYR